MLIKEVKKDKLIARIYSARNEMGIAAASEAVDKIKRLLELKDFVNIVFAAAPSQRETLESIVSRNDIDWSRIRAFHMDEYIGLEENSPQTFATFLQNTIFSKVKFKEVYLIGSGSDSGKTCEKYTRLLKEFPPDLVCLGIGENGHIAFNDPHVADFGDKKLVKVVDLDQKCRIQQVNDKMFGSLEEVPKYAVTLTIPALLGAKYLICTVPSASKAWAVEQTFIAGISEKVPSTILRTHNGAVMFTDKESGAYLLREQ